MMKILIFSTAYIPFVGGAEVAVKELTDRLGGQIEFDLITARLSAQVPKFERVGQVNVYRIGMGVPLFDKLTLPFVGAWETLKLNKRNHYDYFWCIMASFSSGAAFIANWFQTKVPIILTLQEGDSESYLRWKWFGLIELSWRLALARTTHLTTISNYLLERARRLGFRGEATLVPNGVDLDRFSDVKHRVFDQENVSIITTSRLVTKNGIKYLIESLKYLPSAVTLAIVGTGPLERSLRLQAKSLKLETRIQFLGEVSNSEIPKYLSQADIFVRPSLSEGQGISFIEAMAAGLPVVATPVGGIPDFLTDGETGVLCQPKDPKSLAEAIKRLIEDPILRGRVVTGALRLVKERYDWNLIAEEMKSKVFKL